MMAFDLTGKAVRILRLPTVNYDYPSVKSIYAQEGDANTRFFSVTLYDDRGNIPVGKYSKATLNATLPDGKLEFADGEIDAKNNLVICKIAGSMLQQIGKVTCDITLSGADDHDVPTSLTSRTFYLLVRKSQAGDQAVEGSDDYTLLAKLLHEVSELEASTADAEAQRVVAEQARTENELTRQSDESARTAAEERRATAEANRVNEENERSASEATRQTNELARNSAEEARASSEDKRVATENARAAAETVRETAEQARAAEIESLKEYVAKAMTDLPNIRHYGARWNKTQAQMTRMYDAASFPTDITNFAHRGSVNANYSNPFDNIYPWAGIKLCNISIDLYRNLAAGDSITKCVTAWEGDVDFSYNDANGVWRYRPEFWGKSWEDDTYRYFDVSEKAIGSYVHYPEAIVGRWHGRKENRTIGGEEKGCLIPSVGMPSKRIAVSTLHTYAKNYGATIDSIYSVDADDLLCIVEFATMNTQNAIGNGVSKLYRQSSDLIQEDATNSTTVKVFAAAGSAYCIPGAIFDIGTSNGGTQVGSFTVVSATPNVGDAQYLDVTLDQAVTVTGANYWSVHGLANVADEAIGSKSGYIGTNSKCNAYYRGIVMYGNMWLYTLGAYESKDDHHIWIANSDAEADNYGAIDTAVHYDTGLVLPTAEGYIKKLGLLSRSGLLSIPVFCVETGGDSSNPVGDYFYSGSYTYHTVLLRGGHASDGSGDGAFYCDWRRTASIGDWHISARPRLKNP